MQPVISDLPVGLGTPDEIEPIVVVTELSGPELRWVNPFALAPTTVTDNALLMLRQRQVIRIVSDHKHSYRGT